MVQDYYDMVWKLSIELLALITVGMLRVTMCDFFRYNMNVSNMKLSTEYPRSLISLHQDILFTGVQKMSVLVSYMTCDPQYYNIILSGICLYLQKRKV